MHRFLILLAFLVPCVLSAFSWRNLAEEAINLVKSVPRVQDPATCGICEVALDGAKKLLNNSKTQQVIIADALQVCSALPTDLSTGCNDLVNTYEPIITDYIVSSSSAAICLLIGACVSPATDKASITTTLKPMLGLKQSAESRLFASIRKAIVSNGHVAAAGQMAGSSATDYCDQCKMVILEAHSLITNPTVQSSILNYTKQVCDLAGPTVGPTCDQLADMYVPVFFDLLEKAFNSPDEICSMIGLCKPKAMIHKTISGGSTERKKRI